MLIRRARPEDFLEIAALDRIAWMENSSPEYIPDGEHAWRIWVDHAFVFCAVDGKSITGAILAFPAINGDFCIHKIFVRTDVRGNNTGTKLFEALLKKTDELKAASFLTVSPDNISALKLYSKLGFKKKEFKKNFYRKNEDRYLLMRTPV